MSADYLELRIPITENTTKKIVALAALTGKNLVDIKESIAADMIDEEAFDAFVSSLLHDALAEMDGVTEEAPEELVSYSISLKTPKGKKGFAQAEQEAMSVIEDIAGHSLSGDEDTGAMSFEEQYRKEENLLRAAPVNPAEEDFMPPVQAFPDVGSNVDAFIDIGDEDDVPVQASLAKAKPAQAGVKAKRNKKGATISEYTGDEAGEEDVALF